MTVPLTPDEVWRMLLDPARLAAVLPGCEKLDLVGENRYRAEVSLRVGPVRGRYSAAVRLSDLDPPHALKLDGEGEGALGWARGEASLRLEPVASGTRVSYAYSAEIGGKVAAIGGRMLEGAAKILAHQFFARLVAQGAPVSRPSLWSVLLRWLRLAR